MSMPKVLVTRAVFPDVIERLEQHFDVEANQADEILSPEVLNARLLGKSGVFCMPSERITAEMIAARDKAATFGKVVLVLQVIALLTMAVGHYI